MFIVHNPYSGASLKRLLAGIATDKGMWPVWVIKLQIFHLIQFLDSLLRAFSFDLLCYQFTLSSVLFKKNINGSSRTARQRVLMGVCAIVYVTTRSRLGHKRLEASPTRVGLPILATGSAEDPWEYLDGPVGRMGESGW
jgi:hypothetical protein